MLVAECINCYFTNILIKGNEFLLFLLRLLCLSGRPAGFKFKAQTNEVLLSAEFFSSSTSVSIHFPSEDPPQHRLISLALQNWLIQITLAASELLLSLIKSLAN